MDVKKFLMDCVFNAARNFFTKQVTFRKDNFYFFSGRTWQFLREFSINHFYSFLIYLREDIKIIISIYIQKIWSSASTLHYRNCKNRLFKYSIIFIEKL